MDNKETLWIISELFPPEETSTSYYMGFIANALVEKYNVKVICGPKIYDKQRVLNENFNIDPRIEINRIEYSIKRKSNKISQALSFITRSWKLYNIARKNIKSNDKILMVSNPFPLIVLMGYYKKYHKNQLNLIVHDLFPDALYTEIKIPYCILKVMHSMYNKAYSRMDRLIACGHDMAELLERKCRNLKGSPEIMTIVNWGDTESIYPLKSNTSKTKIVIQYAGNIGYSQGIDTFIDMLEYASNDKIEFSIWGSGCAENKLKQRISQSSIRDNVTFNGPYSRSKQCDIINSCDISLIILAKGMYGLGVPSKTYNILAAGKPILYIGDKDSEIWRVIEENNVGYCFQHSEYSKIISFLKNLSYDDIAMLNKMSDRARKIAEEQFSKEVILNKYLSVI